MGCSLAATVRHQQRNVGPQARDVAPATATKCTVVRDNTVRHAVMLEQAVELACYSVDALRSWLITSVLRTAGRVWLIFCVSALLLGGAGLHWNI
jgi:hypothetical protein